MKKEAFLMILASLMFLTTNTEAQKRTTIDRIEPTNWYVGMQDPSLQLMIYGEGIKTANVQIEGGGVKLDSIVRLDSPNYLLLYLNLSDAKAGQIKLNFTNKT